jgi:hypothetical protein
MTGPGAGEVAGAGSAMAAGAARPVERSVNRQEAGA